MIAYENIEITTRSHPEAFPSALRQKRKTQTKVHEGDAGRQKVLLCAAGTRATAKLITHRADDGKVPRMWAHGGVLEGDAGACASGIGRLVLGTHKHVMGLQLRSADEGSTILYTVRRICLPVLSCVLIL